MLASTYPNGRSHIEPTAARLAANLFGLSASVPLTAQEMANALRVTFYPPHEHSPRLDWFTARLRACLVDLGVEVLPFEEALQPSGNGKIQPGIVVIEQGEGQTENLAIHRVSSLYKNPLVALFDRPAPIHGKASLQEKLDAIVEVLAWNLTHVPIFVTDESWTICTMNGSIVECPDFDLMARDVLNVLVPKLTAQVIPPRRSDVKFCEDALDVDAEGLRPFVDDLIESSRIWKRNGLMLSHTSLDDLSYRNGFCRRIVSSYLDQRTGMSYGFLARQLPLQVEPAIRADRAGSAFAGWDADDEPLRTIDGVCYASLEFRGERWFVPVPDVAVIGTRSGCDKTKIDHRRDIVRLARRGGAITFDMPVGLASEDCRPSYDTRTIIAHAVGNAMVASLIRAIDEDAVFPRVLAESGISLSHWHGYIRHDEAPAGYVRFGADNPPVSCSTEQSAAYAFLGKLYALERCLDEGGVFRGDVHVEPHHGTNISGCMSLTESAEWIDQLHARALIAVDDA